MTFFSCACCCNNSSGHFAALLLLQSLSSSSYQCIHPLHLGFSVLCCVLANNFAIFSVVASFNKCMSILVLLQIAFTDKLRHIIILTLHFPLRVFSLCLLLATVFLTSSLCLTLALPVTSLRYLPGNYF